MSEKTFDALKPEEKRALTWQAIRTLHSVLNETGTHIGSAQARDALLDDPARYIREVVENLSEFPDAVEDAREHFRRVTNRQRVTDVRGR